MTVGVLHLAHRKEDKGLALFPFGERYNRELTQLRQGDVIQFESGEKFEVVAVTVMNTDSAVAEFMSRYIYGRPLSVVKSQWYNNAVLEGYPRDCIRADQCLIIYYKSPVHI